MAKKYYVVWKGRQTGIFTTWAQCQAQVDKFAGAKFKSFPSLSEAEAAFGSGSSSITKTTAETKASITSKILGSDNQSKQKRGKSKSSPLTQAQIDAMPFDIKIFTDGASEPNPGEAGAGVAIYQSNKLTELWYGIYQEVGTNNTAELNGLYQAFLIAKEKIRAGLSVAIYSDSMYSIQCITQWAKGWEKKGWVKQGGEIKNLDLIKPMYSLYQEIANSVDIHHVNGHVGIEGNELADRMSIIAIEAKEKELCLYRDEETRTQNYNVAQILAVRRG